MDWKRRDPTSRADLEMNPERAQQYDQERERSLPIIRQEAHQGAPGFTPMEYQPVRSPGLYDGEFGLKDDDLLFHFWPAGYSQALREGRAPPRFSPGFEPALKKAFGEVFGNRFMASLEQDVGSWYVRAYGFGLNQFHRDMAIRACEKLHLYLGGSQS